MKKIISITLLFLITICFPSVVHAQVSDGVDVLHDVLNNVYNQMIPMCADLLEVCQALAGMGTIFYIGVRVWKHFARAEPIDFFPLFRPFVIVILISLFPQTLAVINGVLSPSVDATAAMVEHSNDAVNALLIAEATQTQVDTSSVLMAPNQQAYKDGWDKYAQPDGTGGDDGGGVWSAIGSGFKFVTGGLLYAQKFFFKLLLSVILEVLYFAASLCIDTIRVFHLIVLAILGPFAFAFSCYDGFQQSLTHWLGRYINIYLWLPIANLFGAILGKIQANMLQMDLDRMLSGSLMIFSPTDVAYLIFLLIGIVGYTTVPSLANYIIHTHGGNPLAQKVSQLAGLAVSTAITGGAGAAAGGGMAASGGAGAAGAGTASSGSLAGGMAASAATNPQQYNRDKIAG